MVSQKLSAFVKLHQATKLSLGLTINPVLFTFLIGWHKGRLQYGK